MITLERIATETLVGGGFSWARSKSNPHFGYMVAAPGYERVIRQWDGRTGQIASFVAEHILEVSGSDSLWFGSWMENGDLYLDLSENIIDRREALKVGKERGEISIWDCEAGEVVYL